MDLREYESYLALTLAPGLGPVLTRRALAKLGSAQAVMEASVHQLMSVEGIGRERAGQIYDGMAAVQSSGAVGKEQEAMAAAGARLLILGEPDYPRLLPHISDPPVTLYVRGKLEESDALALAIVGSRKCSQYGREQADRFAALSAQAGLVIVSGGAYGIDAAAHRAALRVQGRTIAVLGSGLARPYPADHAALFDEIVAAGSAVLSELPMHAPPAAENFPRRNRIISGLALGILVVEAAAQSGALITARLAVEDHHREVMAVPGRVDSPGSEGCHRLIREGAATLVTNVGQVLDALGDAGSTLKAGLDDRAERGRAEAEPQPNLFTANLTATQAKIMEALREPMPLDRVAAETGLAIAPLQADITVLEIRGLLRRERGLIHPKRR